ncbi:hypothetical protein BOTBODRAFT_180457 [Botryobasidium botryosum FD-172 SS1]|uniref:Uncharacterized protein n=1 Tax=Botryobasidium botryosum (strain FD-172 SS1) TaxID=930990 RepID=A0A067M887_BOTB1|nr:hypothetical protein BOTBODRAFT_180457 [Botryobasidium botryosum FD-172 SS1]
MSLYHPLLNSAPLLMQRSDCAPQLPHLGPAIVDPYTIALRAVVDEIELHLVVRHRTGNALPPHLHPDHPNVMQWMLGQGNELLQSQDISQELLASAPEYH